MKKVQTLLLSIMAIVGLVTTPLIPATVLAEGSPVDSIQDGVTKVGGTKTGQTELTDMIKIIVNIMLFILGAIAVIMIIIGGIRYTTSNGDASNTKAAKDTILYAVVGLVVAILAYAIVNFVLDAFKSK